VEEHYTNGKDLVITLVAVLLIALGLYLGVNALPTDNGAPLAGMVPTLQPTRALTVPTARPRPVAPLPQPTAAVVYITGNAGDVTYVHQDVNVCIGLCR
jgi:hypothetical protein